MSTKPQDPHHPGHLGKIKTSYILMSAAGRITKCVPPSIWGISCNIKLNNNQNQILFCLWFHIQANSSNMGRRGQTHSDYTMHIIGEAWSWSVNRDFFDEGKVSRFRRTLIKANTLDKWFVLDALLSSARISCQQLCRLTRSWTECDITPYSLLTATLESTDWTDSWWECI